MEIAEKLGIPYSSYTDLEYDDEELYAAADLNLILKLASILSTSPINLLTIDIPEEKTIENFTFSDIANIIKNKLLRTGENIEDFEQRIGWGVSFFLENSDRMSELSIDALYDICKALDIPWWKAVPNVRPA